ncbi:hypothetical protein PG993_009086 [Apiospora rasikravindrae]|uniref:Uncharacterized protein n=1 Tax=Apiospora rasikravindrae TaxID=990691 RepID=A0ABR1SID4_9PEZI
MSTQPFSSSFAVDQAASWLLSHLGECDPDPVKLLVLSKSVHFHLKCLLGGFLGWRPREGSHRQSVAAIVDAKVRYLEQEIRVGSELDDRLVLYYNAAPRVTILGDHDGRSLVEPEDTRIVLMTVQSHPAVLGTFRTTPIDTRRDSGLGTLPTAGDIPLATKVSRDGTCSSRSRGVENLMQ